MERSGRSTAGYSAPLYIETTDRTFRAECCRSKIELEELLDRQTECGSNHECFTRAGLGARHIRCHDRRKESVVAAIVPRTAVKFLWSRYSDLPPQGPVRTYVT